MIGRNTSYIVLTTILVLSMLTSCSIEKRRYNSGYHIEWNRLPSKKEFVNESGQCELNKEVQKLKASDDAVIKPIQTKPFESNVADVNVQVDKSEKNLHSKKELEFNTQLIQPILNQSESSQSTIALDQTKLSAEVHPHAFTSLLCGIVSAGSLLTMFIMSFSPAALVAALLVSIVLFSILAIKLAKSANSDMYYARNRYSGRGLASAGMVLGIVTLVALIGFIAVLGITVVFGAFA